MTLRTQNIRTVRPPNTSSRRKPICRHPRLSSWRAPVRSLVLRYTHERQAAATKTEDCRSNVGLKVWTNGFLLIRQGLRHDTGLWPKETNNVG